MHFCALHIQIFASKGVELKKSSYMKNKSFNTDSETVKGTFITRPYKHKATYILTICVISPLWANL